MRILMPVSFVNRCPISPSFLSEAGAKLFQQRYEISRGCAIAGATRVARMPARPVVAVAVRNRRRVMASMELLLIERVGAEDWNIGKWIEIFKSLFARSGGCQGGAAISAVCAR